MIANTMGVLVAASLGPGDPGLITRASWDALASARCWAWPVAKKGGESYALAILQRGGLSPPSQTLALHFPMIRDRQQLDQYWHEAAKITLEVLQRGTDVHFLVEGDASFYATFRHLERAIRALDPEVQSRVIPGVASPLAAAALSGKALCDGDETVAVIPATVGIEKIESLLDQFEVVVLMKVRPLLPQILEILDRRNLLEKSVFIERAGAPEERVVHDVASLKGRDVHYLSLMIIHNHEGEASLGMKGQP